MAKEFESSYQLNLRTNPQEVIDAIKKIKKELEDLSANTHLFQSVTKEIQNMETIYSQLKAQMGQGIRSDRDFAQLNKTMDNLEISMGAVVDRLSVIQKSSENAFQFKNVADLNSQIQKLNENFQKATQRIQEQRSALGKSLSNLGIDNAKQIAEQITTQQQLEQELEKEYELRRRNYEQAKTAAEQNKINVISAYMGSKKNNIDTGDINNVGIFSERSNPKGSAAGAVNSFISQELKAGVVAGRTFDEILTAIQSRIQAINITFTDSEKVGNLVSNALSQAAAEINKADENVRKTKSDMEQLQNIGVDGARTWSQQAANIINGFRIDSQDLQTIRTAQTETTRLRGEVEKIDNSNVLKPFETRISNLSPRIKNLATNFAETSKTTRQLAKEQSDLAYSFDRFSYSIKMVLSLTNAYRQLRKVITQTFTDVQKLDKAFASIAMVTDKTIGGLWETYDDYAEMANKLGQSTESAIQASALFYQQGLDTADALRLTEDTMKLATLAGADFSTATQQMTAALRGFHMEMDQGAHITDVYSELAAHAAADVNGIAYAMSKTASIANSAGMSFENTAAFLTQMIETTQEAPHQLGL